jgi:hypothetical protein
MKFVLYGKFTKIKNQLDKFDSFFFIKKSKQIPPLHLVLSERAIQTRGQLVKINSTQALH